MVLSSPHRLYKLFHKSPEHLAESKFIDDLDHIVHCFDKSTKLRFRDPAEKQYVKFGGTRDNDPSLGIRFGQLLIPG